VQAICYFYDGEIWEDVITRDVAKMGDQRDQYRMLVANITLSKSMYKHEKLKEE
jgi:hypothetical protein